MSTGGIIADTTNSSIIMTGSYGGSSDEGSGEFIHHCIIIGVPGWGGDAQPDQGQSSNNIIDGGDSNYFESGYHGRGRSIGSCGGIINNTTNSSIIMTGSNCGGSSDEGSGEFIHHCSIICVLVEFLVMKILPSLVFICSRQHHCRTTTAHRNHNPYSPFQ